MKQRDENPENRAAQPNRSSVQRNSPSSSVKQDRPRSASPENISTVSGQQNPRSSGQQKHPRSNAQLEQPSGSGRQTAQGASVTLKKERQVHTHRRGDFRQYLFVVNMALSYITVGSSLGWAAPLLYEAKKHGIEGTKFTVFQSVMIGSLMFLSMLVTPLPAGILCDYIGRKLALIIAGSVSCASWMLVAFITEIEMLYSARVFAGFFAGAVLTIVPLYIAEVARPGIRGSLAVINPIMLLFGAEITFVLGPNVSFRVMAMSCGVAPQLFVVMMFYFPESPHWLIYKKKYDRAQKNFEWLRGMTLASSAELRMEYQQMVDYVEKDFPRLGNFKGLCGTTGNKRALLIVELLTALQRLSGSTAVTAFSTITVPDKNIGSLRPVDVISVLGLCWILATVAALLLIDKVGRVPLLVASCVGCLISNISSAAWFYNNKDNIDSPSTLAAHWFPFASITSYGVFYILGLGSVPAVLQGEMFSQTHRAFASAITVMVVAGMSGFVNMTYTPIAVAFGVHVNFSFYSVISMIALIFTLSFVPETKGKSLQRIQNELTK